MGSIDQQTLNNFIYHLIHVKFKNKIKDLDITISQNYLVLNLFKIKKSQANKEYDYAVINDICDLSNTNNIPIILNISNLNSNQIKALYEYYSKFGFILINNNDNPKIIYLPNKS